MCKDQGSIETKLASVLPAQGRLRCRVKAGVVIIFIGYRETLIGENPMRKIQKKKRKKL
jgi:hypothetical protein